MASSTLFLVDVEAIGKSKFFFKLEKHLKLLEILFLKLCWTKTLFLHQMKMIISLMAYQTLMVI